MRGLYSRAAVIQENTVFLFEDAEQKRRQKKARSSIACW